MRIFLFPALLIAAPALAQELGERTADPAAMLQGLSPGDPQSEIAALAAEAAAHPLGSVENPVRVGGPEGARGYFGRLRCPGGTVPVIGERAEVGVGPYGSVVYAFPLACPGAADTAVVVDLYHAEHAETRAPAGFTIGS